jgi:two-component system heavy metal sensor histidine kinase CusS
MAELAAEVAEYHEAALEEAELRVEVRGDARVSVDADWCGVPSPIC